MPLPLLAAVAGPAAQLFSYNRANFMYDSGQRLTRAYTDISYQVQLFQLYRQDIRDLVALTTEKMTNYHVVAALELGMSATMLGPARLPATVPEWVLWHQLMSLCAAFLFLLTSMWLSTRAAVLAGSLNVQLQTQWIRLPLPDEEMLDQALTKAEEFEGKHIDWVRLPFVGSVAKRFCENSSQRLPLSPGGLGSQGSRMCEATASGNSAMSGMKGGESGRSARSAASSAGGGSPAAPPQGSVGKPQPQKPQQSGQSVDHLYLYQRLQRRWSCYDAYARITMSLGTFWLLLSLAYYEVGWNLCHNDKGFPAVVAALMLSSVVTLLVYLDIHVSRWEMLASAVMVMGGPALVAVGAWAQPKELSETPIYCILADVMHICLSSWWWQLGRLLPGKDLLPTRWKAISYLDIFGPIVKELRSLLDQTGLGGNAYHDEDVIEEITDLFDFVDKDRSGTINKEEWEEAFDVIDGNHSGTITRQEWKRYHGSVAIFDVVDGNGNGAISREEWRRAFKCFDRNGDGTISYDEWYGDVEDSTVLQNLNVSSLDHVTEARVKNARARLTAAMGATGITTRKQRGSLNVAVQIAKLVGMREDDSMILEAKRALAKLELPKEVRYLQMVLQDWHEGEVYKHLDRKHRSDLHKMLQQVAAVDARLGLGAGGGKAPQSKKAAAAAAASPGGGRGKSEGLPTILRTISDASIANLGAEIVPVWTRINPGHGKAAYWVGTPTARNRAGRGEAPPPDALGEEFAVIQAKVSALEDRAENLIRAQVAGRPGEASAMTGLWSDRLKAAVSTPAAQPAGPGLAAPEGLEGMEDMDFDLTDEGVSEAFQAKKDTFRRRHHPVVAFRVTCLLMVLVWSSGFIVHSLRYLSDRGVVDLPGRPRRLAEAAPFFFADLGEPGGSAPASLRGASAAPAATFQLPDSFFRPRSLACSSKRDAGGAPRWIAASNGFLLYALRPGAAAAPEALECPVDEHDSVVSLDCGAEGCRAVVAARGSLWACGGRGGAEPLAATPEAYLRKGPPLQLWAAAPDTATFFAAPRVGGPIVELRSGGGSLQPVAELLLPGGLPPQPRWGLLTVSADGLLVGLYTAPGQPGAAAAVWSLASGSFLGTQALPAGQPDGVDGAEAAEWLGWCAAGAGALLAARPAAAGHGAELRRFPMPSVL